MSDSENDLSLRWVGWLNPRTNVLHPLKLATEPGPDWQKIYVNDTTYIAQLEAELRETQNEVRRDEYDRDNATAAVRWHEHERDRLLAALQVAAGAADALDEDAAKIRTETTKGGRERLAANVEAVGRLIRAALRRPFDVTTPGEANDA